MKEQVQKMPYLYGYLICPWRSKRQPTPVFLPEKSHGQRCLVNNSPWRCKGLDTTERVSSSLVCNKDGITRPWGQDGWVGSVIKTGSLSRKKMGLIDFLHCAQKSLSFKTREIKDVSMNFKPQKLTRGFSSGSAVKESACNVGVAGSILGLGRSPGGGNGNPLWYSWVENPVDRGDWRATVHGVTKSQAWLKPLSMHAKLTRNYVCYLGWNGLLKQQQKDIK